MKIPTAKNRSYGGRERGREGMEKEASMTLHWVTALTSFRGNLEVTLLFALTSSLDLVGVSIK